VVKFYAASQLGIKEFLPAYLYPDLSDEDLLSGVSFASGGAGFDNISAEIAVQHVLLVFNCCTKRHFYFILTCLLSIF
jgi:hypothetical protein